MAASHKHHSGSDDNDTASRMTHATGQGFARTIPKRSVFGTPEEIGNRVGGTFQTLPDNVPSNFRQLGPESSGGNFNEKKPRNYRGDQKFGNPRRYS
jgi:hypothetical protein